MSCNRGSQIVVIYNGSNHVHDYFEFDMPLTFANCGDDQFTCINNALIVELSDMINEL